MGISLYKFKKLTIARIFWDPCIDQIGDEKKKDNALKCKHK